MTTTNKTIDTTNSTSKRIGNVLLWILQIAIAGMFIMVGGSKLAGAPEMVGLFQEIGFGQWFRYLTGTLEILAAVLIVIPSLASLGALLLAKVMLGAVLTHLLLIGGSFAMAFTYLLFALVIAWGRWNNTYKLVQQFKA